MTTLVWDGKKLAADGRMSTANRIAQDDRMKIYMLEGAKVRGEDLICFAFAGDADLRDILVSWIAEDCPPVVDWEGASFGMFLITKTSAYVYGDTSNDLLELETSSSMGSGGEFATVALHLGKDAVASVKLAADMDMFSGGIGTYVNCRIKNPKLIQFDTAIK